MGIEQVWERLKEAALEYATDGHRLSAFRARALVEQFLYEADIEPWPHDEVIEFFTRELLDMTRERPDTNRLQA